MLEFKITEEFQYNNWLRDNIMFSINFPVKAKTFELKGEYDNNFEFFTKFATLSFDTEFTQPSYFFPIFTDSLLFNEQYKEFLYFVIENKELFKSKKLIPVIIDVLEATYEQYPMINFVAAVMEDICKLYFINGDFKFCGPQHENLIHYSCLHWVHHLIHDVPKEIIELKRDHKTFIFLNKMSREHRAMLLNEVLQNIPRHHSYITWTGETSCSDWKKMYPTITEHTFEPLDFEDVMKANPTQYVPLEHCTKSFLYLNTETYYQNNQIFFTEKTFKPIDLGMPFITLGNPGTMAGLREAGFLTFSYWIDESYDNDIPLFDRISIIIKELKKFSSWDNNRRMQVRKDMKDILLHNKKLLTSMRNSEPNLYGILNLIQGNEAV